MEHEGNGADFGALWKQFQAAGASREKTPKNLSALNAQGALHESRDIKCVGVWDTVGSYGVPAGFGLDAIGRYFSQIVLGFRDTAIGDHIEFGLHAIAADEKRRPFTPTLWTAPKNSQPKARVEQTWFAGVHCNIGGGYPDTGLSDLSLIWMIARLQDLAKLEFNEANVLAATRPSVDGEVYNSSKGFWVSSLLPAQRAMLSADAIDHGAVYSSDNPAGEHINERVHWSVLEKRGRPCTIAGKSGVPYNPGNLPASVPQDKIATITPREETLLAPR
jgi:hypothetical protein